MNYKKIIFSFFLLFSISLAHKISAFYDIENGKIIISSYFSDGKPAKHAKVKIIDEKTNKVILTGETNDKGIFTCKLLPPKNYKVVVEGELGHRATTEILKEDILDAEEEVDNSSDISTNNLNSSNVSKKNRQDINLKENVSLNNVENEKTYNQVMLDKKDIAFLLNNQKIILKKLNSIEIKLKKIDAQNKLIKRKILEIEEALTKPNLVQILGGIGWILGIFGGIALFAYRKK